MGDRSVGGFFLLGAPCPDHSANSCEFSDFRHRPGPQWWQQYHRRLLLPYRHLSLLSPAGTVDGLHRRYLSPSAVTVLRNRGLSRHLAGGAIALRHYLRGESRAPSSAIAPSLAIAKTMAPYSTNPPIKGISATATKLSPPLRQKPGLKSVFLRVPSLPEAFPGGC